MIPGCLKKLKISYIIQISACFILVRVKNNKTTKVPPIVGKANGQKDGKHKEKAGGAHAAGTNPDHLRECFALFYLWGKFLR